MFPPVLKTKLNIPPLRSKVVLRPRLNDLLNAGLRKNQSTGSNPGFESKLTVISAPAGFGKTVLVSEWLTGSQFPAAWLSLDAEDKDPLRFLACLTMALQTLESKQASSGDTLNGILGLLQSLQPPPLESLLAAILNSIPAIPHDFILILDDYHVIDSTAVDKVLTYFLDHLPGNIHLVIATREDPNLPLPRLRARGQLNELRAADLRFTPAEAGEFMNQVMGFNLSEDNIAALEKRTEGWIAGLQLAAISFQGQPDVSAFIRSFSGSHRFVMDYLMEEVLHQLPDNIQSFLMHTSILDRVCGPLCDAVTPESPGSGQDTLEYLDRSNLFIVPLDNERRWYRFHHLFADLLRQRLLQSAVSTAKLHIRASQWFDDNGLALEAFQQAAAARDIERASRLIESAGIQTHNRSEVAPILNWLASLTKAELDAHPSLLVTSATMLLSTGQTTGVEEKLKAAETALQNQTLQVNIRELTGEIAVARSTLAMTCYQADVLISQAHRALEYLPPESRVFRTSAFWLMSMGFQIQGDRLAAGRALAEAISLSKVSGDNFTSYLVTLSSGELQEVENQLNPAVENFQRSLQLSREYNLPVDCEAYLGLARIHYEWNDLAASERYGQLALEKARLYENIIDRSIICQVFMARLRLARGDIQGTDSLLAEAEQSARRQNFLHRLPEIAAVQVAVLLHQGKLEAAANLAGTYQLPISRARVLLAGGDSSSALAILAEYRRQMESRHWEDERLKAMVLEIIALQAQGEKDQAVQLLREALTLAKPGGFIRIFADEGIAMSSVLSSAIAGGIMTDYANKLLTIIKVEQPKPEDKTGRRSEIPLDEPLSQRELEVLQLIARGLSNREISQKLFLALDTVKGHNRIIFSKLQVQRRTEAVARARELGLL